MTDPLRFIWPAVEAVRPVFSRAATVRWPAEDHAALVNAKLIVRDGGKSTRIRCPECGKTHVCRPFARVQPDGTMRYFIPCPENLRAEVRQKDLQLWRVDIERLVSIIADALSLTGSPKDLGDCRVWRCGRATFGSVLRDVLFARGLRRKDGATYRRAISSARRPIVFVGSELPAADFWEGSTPPLILLSEITSLVQGRVEFDVDQAAGLVLNRHAGDNDEGNLSLEQLKLLIRRQVKAERKSELTDDFIHSEYAKHGNARDTADALTHMGHPIHFSTVARRVKKYERSARGESSDSIVRSVASQRRNSRKKIQNRPEARDFE